MIPAFVSSAVNTLSGGRIKLGWWSSTWRSVRRPVIIGGCGRSGTTLLRAMLNAHSAFAVGPETGILVGNRDPESIARSTGLHPADVRATLRRSACVGQFVEALCAGPLNPGNKPRWGEKTPANVRHLEFVFRFFPRALFVHMIRDGRDVACSLRTHPKYRWEGGRRVPTNIVNPWEDCIARWREDTRAGLAWRDDPRCLEVRYEHLVESPEVVMRDILSRAEEPWDEAVLAFHATHHETGSDRANPGVTRPVYRSATGRWRSELPIEARRLFRPEASAMLVELGYAPDESWIEEATTPPRPPT